MAIKNRNFFARNSNHDLPSSKKCFEKDSASSVTSFFIVRPTGRSSGNSLRKPVDGLVFTVAERYHTGVGHFLFTGSGTRGFSYTPVPHPLFANYTLAVRGIQRN